MDIQPGYYYHIYNRGNNSQKIFFKRKNYLFFLKKLRENITPFASIIAWCLMPSHFHIVVYVHNNKLVVESDALSTSSSRHPSYSQATTASGGLPTQSLNNRSKAKQKTFNQSFGHMLSAYTKALQKQENFTGSLFQKRTKAKPLIDYIKIDPAYWNTSFGTYINISDGKSYLETCIEYVHQNPVNSGLVKIAEDWEFSSFRDYLGLRKDSLIDYEMIKQEKLGNNRHPNRSRATISENNGLSTQSSDDHLKTNNSVLNTCVIGIGSNINADENIAKMLEILKKEVNVLQVSSMIKTKPIGIKNQPDFTNGAVKISTELDRDDLNKRLKQIEDEMGRDRTGPKFGPRCIDLDIAVWNGEVVDEDYYTRDFLRKNVAELGGITTK